MRIKILLTLILIISTLPISAQINAFFFSGGPSVHTGQAYVDTGATTHWRIQGADCYNNVTYFGWRDRVGPNYKIISYNHTSALWSNINTIRTNETVDGSDHVNPCITVLRTGSDAGKILYTMTGQGDPSDTVHIWKSNSAEDITAWTLKHSFDGGDATWPDVTEFSDSSLFFLYRVAPTEYYFKRSTDQGETWSSDTLFLTLSGGGPYIKSYAEGNRIDLIISHRIVNSAAVPEYQDIFYLYSEDSGYTWKKRDGTEVTIPLDSTELDTVFLSSQSPDEETRDSDIFIDRLGDPHLLIVDDRGHVSGSPHYKVCQYDAGWSCDSVTITNTVYNTANQKILPYGCFDPGDETGNTLIIPDDDFHLARWRYDGGWSLVDYLTINSLQKQVRAIRVKHPNANLRIFWYESTDWMGGFPDAGWGTNVYLRSWPLQRAFYD